MEKILRPARLPRDGPARLDLALAFRRAGRSRRAAEAYLDAARLGSPETTVAVAARGLMDLDPSFTEAWDQILRCLGRSGRRVPASGLSRLLSRQPRLNGSSLAVLWSREAARSLPQGPGSADALARSFRTSLLRLYPA